MIFGLILKLFIIIKNLMYDKKINFEDLDNLLDSALYALKNDSKDMIKQIYSDQSTNISNNNDNSIMNLSLNTVNTTYKNLNQDYHSKNSDHNQKFITKSNTIISRSPENSKHGKHIVSG